MQIKQCVRHLKGGAIVLIAFMILTGQFFQKAVLASDFTDISETSGIKYTGFGNRSWDVLIGDLDQNGINDLYCMAHSQGRTAKYSIIYRSDSSLALTDVTDTVFGSVSATGGGQGALLADLNSDGWLKVKVNGGDQNPYGVGSRISVYDGAELIGYRQVINSSGIQQPLEQHFGLVSATTVRVEVTFPDGSQGAC